MVLSFLLVWGGVGCQTTPRRSVPEKLIPFTANMENFSDDLEEIQFYISQRIVLHRNIELQTKDVTDPLPTLRTEKDTEFQSITFPARTPGVLTGIDDGVLKVQFEPIRDGKDQTIPFRPRQRSGTEPGPQNVVFVFDAERITYGGNEYKVDYLGEDGVLPAEDNTTSAGKAGPAQSGFIADKSYPILLINPIRSINRFEEENRAAPGMREEALPD